MSRLVDGLVAGGLIAGVVWYTRREQRKAESAAAAAERLVRIADARAQIAAAVALADRAVVAGNAAAAGAARPTSSSAPAPSSPSPPTSTPPTSAPSPKPRPTKPAPARRSQGLTRRFDDLFKLHGRGVPVAYLRALAHAESGMNPDDRLGLINVVPIALADYNQRHPSAPFTPEDMRDPAKNVQVAADILRTMIDSLRRHHPDVPNLVEDWSNRRFVELASFSWNAGHSELHGVGRVVRFLKTPPIVVRPADITIDSVFDAAWSARASAHLSNPRKRDYSKGVAASYFREVERDAREPRT